VEPQLIDLPRLTLVGYSARFIGAMAPDANNLQVIPPLWHRLMANRSQAGTPLDRFSYGACRPLSSAQQSRPDELEYLAGVSVRADAAVPSGYSRWDIPASTYALFVHRGPLGQSLTDTINHAHTAWLPRSKYIHADSRIELERYDERFMPDHPESVMEYLIAVKRK
jgi:predicted transcriptional regulator YdeE